MNLEICEHCGTQYAIGQDYRCPHAALGSGGVIDDTVTGGARYFHNLGDEPVWIETRSELKKIMAERGLVHSERASYNKDDRSPWATRTRLRPGARDPFIHKASR
jgi:hypothetical protein